MSMPKLHMMKE